MSSTCFLPFSLALCLFSGAFLASLTIQLAPRRGISGIINFPVLSSLILTTWKTHGHDKGQPLHVAMPGLENTLKAEHKALAGDNESQDSQQILEAYMRQYGIGNVGCVGGDVNCQMVATQTIFGV